MDVVLFAVTGAVQLCGDAGHCQVVNQTQSIPHTYATMHTSNTSVVSGVNEFSLDGVYLAEVHSQVTGFCESTATHRTQVLADWSRRWLQLTATSCWRFITACTQQPLQTTDRCFYSFISGTRALQSTLRIRFMTVYRGHHASVTRHNTL